jgi:hypothetical protein
MDILTQFPAKVKYFCSIFRRRQKEKGLPQIICGNPGGIGTIMRLQLLRLPFPG